MDYGESEKITHTKIMQKIDLFSSPIYKTKISPDSYNKEQLIKEIQKNYELDPNRNIWDNDSDLHHYYGDWVNPNFNPVDIDKLLGEYNTKIFEFMGNFPFSKETKCSWCLLNISASKTNQFMRSHYHEDTFYSGVHYISLKEGHSTTTFHNPLIVGQYDNTWSHVRPFMRNTSENSSYFEEWNLHVEEDDFILFPSYLKHGVKRNKENENLRITTSVGIKLQESST